jgi:hypothetical protein
MLGEDKCPGGSRNAIAGERVLFSGLHDAASFNWFDRPSELIGMTADRKVCEQPWLLTYQETCQDIRLQ